MSARKRSRSETAHPPKGAVWIVDGHNVIFDDPALQNLQLGDRKRQARDTLVERAARFGSRYSGQVIVVFDGIDVPVHEDSQRSGNVEVIFASPEETADRRILFLARRYRREGRNVQVITNDRELRDKLASGAGVMGTERFRRRVASPDRGTQVDRTFVDPELEAYFMGLEEEAAEEKNQAPANKPKKPLLSGLLNRFGRATDKAPSPLQTPEAGRPSSSRQTEKRKETTPEAIKESRRRRYLRRQERQKSRGKKRR